jgi:hypothetical protein
VDEAALILARFYMSPPADPGGSAKKDSVYGIDYRPDSTFNMRPVGILVNARATSVAR